MKKIIYSLVIMIAAGSLFTSCVTNTEPQGIKDIRQAKADYIDALSNLKKAEAEKVKAEAAYQDALTAYQNAQTALVEADVKAKEIRNSVLDAKAQAEIEKTLAAAQLAAVTAAKDLAKAEFELQQTLNWIAVESEKLTDQEVKAIDAYVTAYDDYLKAEQAVRAAEAKVYYSDLKYAEAIQQLKLDTAKASAKIAANQMFLNNLPDSGASESEIKALFAQYNQEATDAKYELANIDAEWNLYRQTEVAENIKGFATELSEWVVKNAALPAPYAVHYRADLPDNDQVNKLFAKYFKQQGNNNVEVSLEDKAIAANFYSIPSAIEGLEDLNTVVCALNRELVVDSTKYGIDTTGMSVAVAEAWEHYDDVLAALKAGVDAYEPVIDAKKDLKDANKDLEDAKEALEDAKEAYVADKADLKAAIENFEKVWNEIDIIDKNDTTALVDALHKLSVARDVLPYDEHGPRKYFYFKTKKEVGGTPTIVTDSVAFSALTKAHITEGDKWSIYEGHNLLSSAINQFFGCNYFDSKIHIATAKLDPISLDDLYKAENTNYFSTLFFGKYWAQDKTIARINYAGVDDGMKEYIPAAVEEALETVSDASDVVLDAEIDSVEAIKGYYNDIYCEFWGIDYNPKILTEDLKLKDSLVINFTKETFTDEHPIITFFDTKGGNYSAKDTSFNIPRRLTVDDNAELDIVLEQLKQKLSWKAEMNINKLLLTKVLWCEFFAANYSIGSEGTTKALARLQEIEAELFAEAIVAIAKQVEDSEPFFAFVENLFGKECIDGFFARIDSAATAAAEFVPATTDSQENIVKLIAEGKLTSKQIFTLGFEFFMCGGFGEDSAYRTAYEHMQIAKAFTGEEFADLVSDVIAAYIQAKDIKLDVEGYDNIIEKILFGTVEKVNLVADKPFENALKIVAPVVGPYFYNSFGGKIAELQDKYFTEWAAAWATYDVNSTAVKARLEEIETEAKIVAEYAKDVKTLIRRADHYRANIAAAIDEYVKACETLKAIAAGADWRSLLNEKIADDLAKAQAALEAAAAKLKAAKAAYDQVIANHE